jgi:hypothetical protein
MYLLCSAHPQVPASKHRNRPTPQHGTASIRLRYENLVDGDVDDADEVADGAHDDEAETDGLAEFGEFALRGCIRRLRLELWFLGKMDFNIDADAGTYVSGSGS